MPLEGGRYARICTVVVVLVVVGSGIVTGVGAISTSVADGTATTASTANTTLVVDDEADGDGEYPTTQASVGSTLADPRVKADQGTYREKFVEAAEDIDIQHDPYHVGGTFDEDTHAEDLFLTTTDPDEPFAFGGDLDRVLVIRDVETDRTIVLDPKSGFVNVTWVEFDFKDAEGHISSNESIKVELSNGSRVSIDVSVTGDLSLFEPDPSPFGQYQIELRNGYQQGDSVGETQLIDATEPRLVGIGYNGEIVQNSTTGTIQVSVPRHEDIDESWYIEYSVSNDTHRDLITKEVIDSAGDDNLTIEIDASKLENGSYSDRFTIRQSEEELPLSSRVISIIRVDDLTIGAQDGSVADQSPTIHGRTFTIEPYPVKVGETPHVSVNVTDAANVRVKATFDGRTVTREMERRSGATWRTVQSLPAISEPGTEVKVEIVAENGNKTDTLTKFNNSYLEFNETLRYYVFRERQDILVVLGTFADEDPFGNATRLEDETDLRAWERAREFDINHYYGSVNGSMGARGFDFVYKDNGGDFYRVGNLREQYLGDAVAYLEDLKAAADSDVTFTDYDDWIGTHPGNTTVRRAFVINSKRMYVSMTHFNDTGSHAGVWAHELGHTFGLDDLYNKGNVSRNQSLMADGSISYHSRAMAANNPTHGHIFRQNPPPINAVTRLGRNGGGVNWLEENTTKVSDLTDDPRILRVDALHSYSLGDRVPVVDGGTLGSSTDYILEGRFDLRDGAVVVYRHYSNPLDTTIDSLPPLHTPGQTLEDKIGLADPVFVTLTLVNETGDRTQYRAAVRANATAKPNVVVGALQPVITGGLDALSRPNVTAPDLDLVAVDSQGRRVGQTANRGYVNEIPGADASGDRRGVEWIAVPEDVDVQFRVVSTDARRFLNETGHRNGNLSIRFRTSTTHYGDEPRITEENDTVTVTNTTVAISPNRSIEPGETAVAIRNPLFAAFTVSPPRPSPNQTVTFDASLSYSLNTTITDHEWAFGDGTTATGKQITHAYTDTGSYTVTLTVTDATGRTSTTRETVTIRSEPRAPDVTGDGNPARDPDGDGLYEDVNGDGDVTPGDATVLFNAVFEGNTAVTENTAAFDFNGDGSVTPGDATVLFNEVF